MVATGKMAYLLTKNELSGFDRLKYLGLNRRKNELISRRDKASKRLKALGANAGGAEGKALSEEIEKIKTGLGELDSQMPSCFLWTIECAYPHSLILAGDVLFAGGDDSVAAFSIRNGKHLWNAVVKGKAHGLAVANGCLLVSTDVGRIHCFVAR